MSTRLDDCDEEHDDHRLLELAQWVHDAMPHRADVHRGQLPLAVYDLLRRLDVVAREPDAVAREPVQFLCPQAQAPKAPVQPVWGGTANSTGEDLVVVTGTHGQLERGGR